MNGHGAPQDKSDRVSLDLGVGRGGYPDSSTPQARSAPCLGIRGSVHDSAHALPAATPGTVRSPEKMASEEELLVRKLLDPFCLCSGILFSDWALVFALRREMLSMAAACPSVWEEVMTGVSFSSHTVVYKPWGTVLNFAALLGAYWTPNTRKCQTMLLLKKIKPMVKEIRVWKSGFPVQLLKVVRHHGNNTCKVNFLLPWPIPVRTTSKSMQRARHFDEANWQWINEVQYHKFPLAISPKAGLKTE